MNYGISRDFGFNSVSVGTVTWFSKENMKEEMAFNLDEENEE